MPWVRWIRPWFLKMNPTLSKAPIFSTGAVFDQISEPLSYCTILSKNKRTVNHYLTVPSWVKIKEKLHPSPKVEAFGSTPSLSNAQGTSYVLEICCIIGLWAQDHLLREAWPSPLGVLRDITCTRLGFPLARHLWRSNRPRLRSLLGLAFLIDCTPIYMYLHQAIHASNFRWHTSL
jgi:hypothetical protein